MSTIAKQGSFTLNTATGNQSITGLGFTPKLVIFWATQVATISGGNEAHRFYGAATSSTNQWVILSSANPYANQVGRQILTTKCIRFNDASTSSAIFEAGFVSMDSNGFTVNVTTGASITIYYFALGGASFTAKVGYFDVPSTANGTSQAVTGVGFKPKATLFAFGPQNTSGATTQSSYESPDNGEGLNMGFASSPTEQESISHWFNPSSHAAVSSADTGYCVLGYGYNADGFDNKAHLTSLDSDGFTLNWDVKWSGSSLRMLYIAMGGNSNYKVGAIVDPGTTGYQSYQTTGVKPIAEIFMSPGVAESTPAVTRDPLKQPFSSSSIWNMPIGSSAQYVAANLQTTWSSATYGADGTYAPMPAAEEDYIIQTPNSPLRTVYYSSGGWGGDRCALTSTVLFSAPIPDSYVVASSGDNGSTAFLAADGRTIKQSQPFARCTSGGSISSYVYMTPDEDLYGTGITGSHGGSGLSALGGTIRLGELRPTDTVGPRHALKVVIHAKTALYKATTRAEGYRWPAITSDSYAVGWYGVDSNNNNTAMKMGSLLAIPTSTAITSLGLETAPAKLLAWTLQNYGAYIVDDTYGPGISIAVERGPDGAFIDQFQSDYGFAFAQRIPDNTPWTRDIARLMQALYCINNNTSSTIGGGGTPLQSLAPSIQPPTAGSSRDPLQWPFSQTSIWNMPIGSGAVFGASNLNGNPTDPNNSTDTQYAPMPAADFERLVLSPSSPVININYSSAGWGGDRCPATGGLLITAPVPNSYVLPSGVHNDCAAFLQPDGRTISQTQPLARCTAGGPATSLVTFSDVDIYSDGITGSHGGSGMSALGGTIRLGELRPGQTGMNHSLKVDVYAAQFLYKASTRTPSNYSSGGTGGAYRWPATTSDGYWSSGYGSNSNAVNNSNPDMCMGALLAIPGTVDITTLSLETTPAMQLAWTLQNYGAYIVDDSAGPAYYFCIESGANGNKATEFQNDWGFAFEQRLIDNTPWVRDIQRLMTALRVVKNNSPTSIGGGGTPRQPLAPVISPNGTTGSSNSLRFDFGVAVNSTQRSTSSICIPSGSTSASGTGAVGASIASAALGRYNTNGVTPTWDTQADIVSQNSNGFTLNWTQTAGSSFRFPYLAIGEPLSVTARMMIGIFN